MISTVCPLSPLYQIGVLLNRREDSNLHIDIVISRLHDILSARRVHNARAPCGENTVVSPGRDLPTYADPEDPALACAQSFREFLFILYVQHQVEHSVLKP